ncbi:globin domain-containing protein [Frigoribacterium sp. 2-23]|uniref:globin domain-containing protein n=1 Tax=Frigoribacterium sp. 2-23 TaxID=3415006 RepID=UPI003C6EF75C
MLTSSHLATLRSTLPLVAAAADDIADDFYARLFADRPDLLRDQFNRGDQAQGRQQRELARTIVALADDVVGTQVGSHVPQLPGTHTTVGADSAGSDSRGSGSAGAGSASAGSASAGSASAREASAAVAVAPWSVSAPASWAVRSAAREITSRLAQRHAALRIGRSEYDLFERHLGAAFAAALGDAWTEEAREAWSTVYRQTRDELVTSVEAVYRAADQPLDDDWREALITDYRLVAEDVVALTLVSADSEALPPYRAGQFASIQVVLPDGARQIRQYSLRGGSDEQWRISARVLDGEGVVPDGEVSTHLRDHLSAGDVVSVSPPIGSLTIDELDDAPLVLVSAGIGCTPVLGMLDHLARTEPTREVTVLHFERTPERHAHRAELEALVASMPNARLRVSYTGGSLSALSALGVPLSEVSLDGVGAYLEPIDLDVARLTASHRVFLCGPVPFMAIARAALIEHGVPASRVHYFVFGPDDGTVVGADTGQRRPQP